MTRSSLRLAVLALSALLSVGGGSAVHAQAAPQKYEVTGFRDARFGMTETEVRNSALKRSGSSPPISRAQPMLWKERRC